MFTNINLLDFFKCVLINNVCGLGKGYGVDTSPSGL